MYEIKVEGEFNMARHRAEHRAEFFKKRPLLYHGGYFDSF